MCLDGFFGISVFLIQCLHSCEVSARPLPRSQQFGNRSICFGRRSSGSSSGACNADLNTRGAYPALGTSICRSLSPSPSQGGFQGGWVIGDYQLSLPRLADLPHVLTSAGLDSKRPLPSTKGPTAHGYDWSGLGTGVEDLLKLQERRADLHTLEQWLSARHGDLQPYILS